MEQALVRALDPEYINESKFVPPVEEGEETKAIPIITDDQINGEMSHADETIVHSPSDTTKTYTTSEGDHEEEDEVKQDRKSTRLNSSHVAISYAVFCTKKKKNKVKKT